MPSFWSYVFRATMYFLRGLGILRSFPSSCLCFDCSFQSASSARLQRLVTSEINQPQVKHFSGSVMSMKNWISSSILTVIILRSEQSMPLFDYIGKFVYFVLSWRGQFLRTYTQNSSFESARTTYLLLCQIESRPSAWLKYSSLLFYRNGCLSPSLLG